MTTNPTRLSCNELVTNLNDHGVLRLQQGKFTEAMNIFQSALKKLVEMFRHEDLHPEVLDSGRSSHYGRPPSERIVFSHQILLKNGKYDQLCNSFALFSRGLTISYEAVDESNLYSTVLSSVLLFNCGLVRHLIALQRQNPSSLSQRQDSSSSGADADADAARRFYSMSERALSTLVQSNAPLQEYWTSASALVLGLYNNAGQLYEHIGESEHASVCRDMLSWRLWIILNTDPEDMLRILTYEELPTFIKSGLHVLGGRKAVSEYTAKAA